MPSSLVWLRAAAVATLAAQVAGQAKCYYPNGSEAPSTDKPCSSADGSACCPDNWQCLDNGLCYYPVNKQYGRYSCTDKNWDSPGCASNLCTYDMSAGGGESIKQCSNHDNNWCCNGDDTNVKCCQESPSPRPFFALQDGRAYATIGSNQAQSVPTISGITGLVSGTGSGSSKPTQTAGSSNAPTSTPSTTRGSSVTANDVSTTSVPTPTRFTSVSTSVSSGSAGIKTVIVTSVVTPSTSPSAAAADGGGKKSSNLGVIIGCAVGIPLALALLGILIWLLRKRRNQKANPYKSTPELDGDNPNSPGYLGVAAANKKEFRSSRPGTAEIDGNPVGAGYPISHIKGHAELDSGTGFQPGHGAAYAPDTVGLGGGSGTGRETWGSVPPQYSPAHPQGAFSAHAGATELDATSAMPAISEKTDAPQQYVAYKQPAGVAELPTVKTPPEDLEKQMHR